MGLTRYEKETIVNWNEAESSASVYTFNRALQEQLLQACLDYPGQASCTADNGCGGLTFSLPKKWVKVRPPRTLSSAQREALARMNSRRWGKTGGAGGGTGPEMQKGHKNTGGM